MTRRLRSAQPAPLNNLLGAPLPPLLQEDGLQILTALVGKRISHLKWRLAPSHAVFWKINSGPRWRRKGEPSLCGHPAGSGGLRLHRPPVCGPGQQRQHLVLRLRQRVDHGHVHIAVVSLLEPPATLVTCEVQLGLGLVFGHMVLEGRPLPALEPTDLTPGGHGQVSEGTALA